MALEDLSGTDKGINDLVPQNPDGLDPRSEGDNHIRGVKNVLVNTFGPMESATVALPASGAALVWDGAKYVPGVIQSARIGDIKFSIRGDSSDGWLVADGRLITPGTYAELFAELAADTTLRTTWANWNAITYGFFAYVNDDPAQGVRLPKLLGRVLRATNNVDAALPDFGRGSGNQQAHGFQDHAHAVSDPTHAHGTNAGGGPGTSFPYENAILGGYAASVYAAATGISVGGASSGNPGTETRMENMSEYCLVFCGKP